ncbi:MAG: nucleotidyltransferase domain-containing protein [Deltaproteobacteria bacterium]|nr:nucleotidyltransferase domain-containing protein [Deltaproteobacteria bacterium]MBW1911504.1 nucleotidyltransferase domain-containing protein [Deltaproteobacteria bacterium]MBW2034263.1 nucleotidyltransferase domain-containing protein [Deltaproteobacteria bacterium]MBW2115514.1 nucleotidyltransferase domain-containing protein [Deltaproteobacteria bacterium]
MKQHLSHKDILRLLKAEKAFLRNEFGVINIGLFGSYVKGNQRADSDIDLLVELKEPRFEWIAGLQMYLEKKFDKKIELVRKSDNVNRRFTQRIENEVIYA